MELNLSRKYGIQKELREHMARKGAVGIPWGTPVNSDEATVTLAAADIAVINNDDIVVFDGAIFTKKGAADAAAREWDDAEALAAQIDALEDWDGAESTGAVVITASYGSTLFNGRPLFVAIKEATTAGGDPSTAATATIEAATIARMANGDTVTFDGKTYTKAAATDVGDKEFENAAGLAACIDAETDWEAAESGDITVTAAADGAEFNDRDVVVFLSRVTAGGVNGTPAYGKGAVMADANRIYVCVDGGPVSNVTWKQIPVALTDL